MSYNYYLSKETEEGDVGHFDPHVPAPKAFDDVFIDNLKIPPPKPSFALWASNNHSDRLLGFMFVLDYHDGFPPD
jgi:hypothetical protein